MAQQRSAVANAPFNVPKPDPQRVEERVFEALDDQHYRMVLKPANIVFDADRVRRSSHEMWGELKVTVNGSFPKAQTIIDGVVSVGDMNFSSVSARSTRAKLLADRSRAPQLDWFGFLEEFTVKLIEAERYGSPDINLQAVPRPAIDREFTIDGVMLPLRHPTILFGDGGTAKSYLAMYWAGKLVQAGHRVLYADWEFTPEEHRERLEYLFGVDFPAIRYLSCYRSFREERDRLRRTIERQAITYMICDSVGLACGGDPSTAEAATTYFQALRTLGDIGSLHIAHVTKSTMKGEDQKPFGSAFWHNMARRTWNVKSEAIGDSASALALYPRKNNLKNRVKPTGYMLTFGDLITTITQADIKEHAALEEGLPLAERLADAVSYGSKTRKELAEMLDVDYPTLQRTIYREIKRGNLIEIEAAMKGKARIAKAVKPSPF